MLRKSSLLFLLFTFMLMFLTSCYDATEIDNSIYAIVVGLDKGTTNKIRVTIQYPTYKEGGGGAPTQSKDSGDVSQENKLEGSNVHSMEAASILEAINLFNTAITRSTSLTHTKMLVISEELARDGIEPYLAPLARYREVRRTMQVVISRGNADEFIRQNKTNIGPSTSKAAELMIEQAATTGYFPRVSFDDFYAMILSPYSEAVASYAGINEFNNLKKNIYGENKSVDVQKGILPGEAARIGVTKREFIGSVAFLGAKMVGTMDSAETRLLLMIQNKFKNGIMTFIDKKSPRNAIPCDLRLGRDTKITARFEDGKPMINVKLNIEADVGAIQSRINYEDIGRIQELNNIIAEDLKMRAEKLIKKSQNEFKADIFGFGFVISKKFKTIQEFSDYNWILKYPEAVVTVDVKVNIRRTGLMIKSAVIPDYTEENETEGKGQ